MKRYKKKLIQLKRNLKNSLLSSTILLFIFSNACVLQKSPSVSLSTEEEKLTVFNQIRSKWNGIQSLSGYFRISANIKNKQGSVKALLAITLPDKLRMELISPGGTTMAILTLFQGTLRLYYPSENVLYFGNADDKNIAKVFGISLKPEEMLPLFIGMGFDLAKNPTRLVSDGNALIAEFPSENNAIMFIVELDARNYAVDGVKAIKTIENLIFAQVKYKEMVYRDNFAYPRMADIDFPQEDSSYKIRITNAQFLVKSLEDKVFQINIRSDAKIYRIENIEVRGTLLFGEK